MPRFNYTGRRKIKSEDISLVLTGADQAVAFKAALKLDDYNLPDHGRVFVEAYVRQNAMRFDFGTVASVKAPADTLLSEFSSEILSQVLFRVRVVEIDETGKVAGKVLAEARQIRTSDEEDDTVKVRSVLPVRLRDLGSRVWKVDLDDDGPMLVWNSKAVDSVDATRNDHSLSLVFPEALAQILGAMPSKLDIVSCDFDDGPYEFFLRYARKLIPSNLDPADEQLELAAWRDWVDLVVDKFCADNRCLSAFERSSDTSQQVGVS